MVAFPAECSKCNRAINAPRFGCGWDEQHAGRGKVRHEWAPDLKTCPRYYLESDRDIERVLYDLEDYRRGSLGPIGQLPATLVDYLRLADATQRRWAEEGEAV